MCVYVQYINKYTLLGDVCSKCLSVRGVYPGKFPVHSSRGMLFKVWSWEHFRNAES